MKLSTRRILAGESVRKSILEASVFKVTIEPGDSIQVGNEKVTVKEILFQDVYVNPDEPKRSAADVEFKDAQGNYRHWQSWSDGGTLTTKDSTYKFEKE